jgi:tetratricopeptide (TPR) repeat protein
MDAFTLEESRQLLLCSMQPSLDQQNLRTHPEYHLAATASKLVDRLPLAISMIAGYVQVSRCTLSEFLEIWDERQSRSRKTTKKVENSAIDTLWDIGIRELSLPARNLLEVLVFLDAESIPKTLLVGDHKQPFLEFLNCSETIRYRRMIAELSGRKLVHVKVQDGQQVLSIHRLLQEKILQNLQVDELTEVFGKAYCLVRKNFPPASPIQVPEPDKAPACKEYIPHVLSLRRAFNDITAIEPSFDLAQLFYDAGFHVWERQTAPDEGVLYLKTAERILDRLNYDPHAKIRADIHTAMAMLYSIIGISVRTQTLQRLRDAHTIRQKVYELDTLSRENDILCTNAASDLGHYLLETWAYEEADKIYQACYEKYCEWGIENDLPFEYSKHYYNNARLCMHRGRYSEAVRLFWKGMELGERALGKTWFYWNVQFTLACTMLQMGEAQSALEIHLKGFSEQEKALGKYDSATMTSNYAVGAVYHHLGNYSAAV